MVRVHGVVPAICVTYINTQKDITSRIMIIRVHGVVPDSCLTYIEGHHRQDNDG